jgi:hypothetical protein
MPFRFVPRLQVREREDLVRNSKANCAFGCRRGIGWN